MRITPVAVVALPPVPDGVATVPQAPVRLPNPQPVIDPALGVAVTEYSSRPGQVTEAVPDARAIETYRIHGLQGDADEP